MPTNRQYSHDQYLIPFLGQGILVFHNKTLLTHHLEEFLQDHNQLFLSNLFHQQVYSQALGLYELFLYDAVPQQQVQFVLHKILRLLQGNVFISRIFYIIHLL